MYFTPLQNRGLLNTENGSLTIFNLENHDIGIYVFEYLDSAKKSDNLTFMLHVLSPPPEPEISCNISGDHFVLKCKSDFQKPLDYTWKSDTLPTTHQRQEISIPKKNAPGKVTCFIKFSQTEKSSEISLASCSSDKKGDDYHKRNRTALIMAFVFVIIVLLILAIIGFLLKRGGTKFLARRSAQNTPVRGSAEHQLLSSADSQEQPNSDRATSSQAVGYENEKPEAGKELNKEDSALKEEHVVSSGVNQEDTSKKEKSSLLDKHAGDYGINEGEVTQDAEGGNGE